MCDIVMGVCYLRTCVFHNVCLTWYNVCSISLTDYAKYNSTSDTSSHTISVCVCARVEGVCMFQEPLLGF